MLGLASDMTTDLSSNITEMTSTLASSITEMTSTIASKITAEMTSNLTELTSTLASNATEMTSNMTELTTPTGVVFAEDQPFFAISEEDYEQFSYVTNVVVTPIICGLGLIGNALGVGVLWRDSKREKLTIYVYMCSLTFIDSIYLFFGVLRSIPNLIRVVDKYMANMIDEHMKLGSIYIDMVLTYSATLVILVMAVERLMALTRPFTVKHSWLTKYPKRIICACLGANMLFFMPYPMNFEVASYKNAENRTEYYIQYKSESLELMDNFTFIHTIIHNYIPGITILFVNIAIVIAFSRILKERSDTLQMSAGQSRQQAKLTLTIFCITVMYFLFNLPDLFVKTLAFVDKRYSITGKYSLSFWLFMDLTNLFTYLNAANDFVIYILVSDHYRRIFKHMYCQCCLKKGDSYLDAEDGSSRATDKTDASSTQPDKY